MPGISTSPGGVPILLFDHFADSGNVTTGETDLFSDTIAANQLGSNGSKLSSQYGGIYVSSGTASRVTGLTLSGTNILKITGQAAGVGAATNDIVAKLATASWSIAA